jgi:HPt (histidine-containing phosphotransfer) domain-containing protein
MTSLQSQTPRCETVSKHDLPPANEQLKLLLLKLWETSKATIAERLETIRQAQARMANNTLKAADRKNAIDAAHKLAGILGTFGLPEGTELARQVEEGMQETAPGSGLSADDLDALVKQLAVLIDQKSAGI